MRNVQIAEAAFNERECAYVLREVLHALVYLHANHHIHRDVKAANILLSNDAAVKVRGCLPRRSGGRKLCVPRYSSHSREG